MTREELPSRITINPNVCFGKPCSSGRQSTRASPSFAFRPNLLPATCSPPREPSSAHWPKAKSAEDSRSSSPAASASTRNPPATNASHL